MKLVILLLTLCSSAMSCREIERSSLTAASTSSKPQKLDVPNYGSLNVISYSPASSGEYIGSPSIVVLGKNRLLASHDIFASGDRQYGTLFYLSKDDGATWTKLSDAYKYLHWGNMFSFNGALYIMGVANGATRSDMRLYRSTDEGKNWGAAAIIQKGKFSTAPTPIVVANGRIYRASEDCWGTGFAQCDAMLLSAPQNANLMDPTSWSSSTKVRYASTKGPGSTFLEGNPVVSPEGAVLDILRVHTTSGPEYAAILENNARTNVLTYRKHIKFNGGSKKFTIRYDAQTKKYWTLSNAIQPGDVVNPDGGTERTRNRLALMASSDLENWEYRATILYHSDVAKVGFQYVDWQFDGEDLVTAIRTSFNGASNSHNANYLTYKRIKGFRTLRSP